MNRINEHTPIRAPGPGGDAVRPLIIGDQPVFPGERREVFLKFSESYFGVDMFVPVYVSRAAEAGPHVFLTAALHGDELNGMGVIRELLANPPDLIRGTLICVPVINVFGLEQHARYMSDRRDLNRCFPGSDSGSASSRLANAVLTEIVQHCDYGIDFHSAAIRRTNYPNVRADMTHAETARLAKAFGCEIVVNSRGPKGCLRRTAVTKGVASIILEAGEVYKIEPIAVETGVAGCVNVLRALGMVEGQPVAPVFQVTVKKTAWVRAERGGILTYHVSPGDLVKKDQEIATNSSIFGKERRQLRSPVDGIVLGMTTMPAVKPGEPVYHIAALSRRNMAHIRQAIDANPDAAQRFARMRDELATNVRVQRRHTI